jgi:Icc-related predicted phosphoesterase
MKLNILSDLHLSRGPLQLPDNDADAVILAGDVARPAQAVSWAKELAKPVFYVPGNHEFYGSSIAGTTNELKRLCAGSDVRVLDKGEAIFEGVRFLGATLWTDFMLLGASEVATAVREALTRMRDFTAIYLDEAQETLFTPADAAALFDCQAAWLAGKLAESYAGPTVVITHHAPSRRSIDPRFAGSLLNACFVSDADYLVDGSRACLWVHGHVHQGFDYVLSGTRVVCNPRGYAKDGVDENPAFDANFLVEVDRPAATAGR